jgi:hypothetical protein
MINFIKIVLLIFICTSIFFEFSAAQNRTFEIISQNNDELVVKYFPQSYNLIPVEIDGATYFTAIGKTSGLTNEIGKPALPVEAALIALPPNKKLTAEVIESKYELLENQNIAPVPFEEYDEDGNTKEIYQLDIKFYNLETNYYPHTIIKIDQPIRIRDQATAKILVFPMQYQPANKTLKQFTHLIIRLKFVDEQIKKDLISVSSADKYYDPMYKSLILNYSQSKNWRVREKQISELKKTDPTTDWWEAGRQYYRIPITQDGMYRLTYTQLSNAGIDLQTLPISTIAMYYRGKSIPIIVDIADANFQNWYIDFYGTRKYGDSAFYDIYNDTSYYWLTWNDTRPQRFSVQPTDGTSPVYTSNAYSAFRHFERDSNYYYGYNDNEIRTVTNVSGEGWYWLDFVSTVTKTVTFYIDTLNPGRFDSAYFKSRFHGMTAYDDTNRSRHKVKVTLNGKVLGEVLWIQNQELIFNAGFLDTLLKKGTNTLQITGTMVKLSKFYLDWFELSYKCPISAENNYLDFNATSQSTADPTLYQVAKLNTDSIDVFDLTNDRIIKNISKQGNLWTFKDTSLSAKRYVAMNKNIRFTPSALLPHTFPNIRSNLSGSDYIVITHSLFKSSAITLANSRSASGLRTNVIDVQDIYNEFNYGHKEPSTIKQFLKYTYYNWPQPAPSYVVMFGDACLDFKKKMPSTTKVDYLPGFGIPMSDNQLVCFDSVNYFIPSMNIGRIPVENSTQASRVVTKILNYDNPPYDDWNKKTLLIAGGTNDSERWQFNALSDLLINESITPPPLGGQAYKVYKTSSAIIDGDSKQYMQGLVNEGLSFINFIGHSGGRIWNVDIGSPNDLQNTSGKLPFVSSVSCNVGAFYSTYANVLSEDFLMADNRGGIGAWASSNVGSAQTGYYLAKKFLAEAVQESLRTFGELTTASRIYFWAINGYVITPTTIHTLNLYPLIGDPYSKFALPQKPDFLLKPEYLTYTPETPVADNFVYLKINVHNYGLMPADSILISVRDNYTDELGLSKGESDIVPPFKWRPIAYSDTILIEWDVRNKAGNHIVKVNVDPLNEIQESNESNNYSELTVYVNRNVIYSLNPKPFSVVQNVAQNLRVTVPTTYDSTKVKHTEKKDTLLYPKQSYNTIPPFTFFFELDTASNFNSPFKITSSPVTPAQVYAEWTTPSLSNEQVYYWRARTYDGKRYGAWATSSFIVSDSAYLASKIKWKQSKVQQFSLDDQRRVFLTDSGVTMQRTNGLPLYVRSLGSRAYPDSDYYSIIQIGATKIIGHWWSGAYSYIAARINPLSGSYEAKGYTLSNLGQPDSLLNFLQSAPVGYYVALSVVQNGQSGMNEALYQMFEQLGATRIRSVTSGQAWCLISRKGTTSPLMPPLESYSPTAVADSDYQMPNYYSAGIGEVKPPLIGPASAWNTLYWDNQVYSNTDIKIKLIGVKKDFTIDTLMTLQSTEKFADLTSINSFIYPNLQLYAILSNLDGLATPVLKNWSIVYTPTPELATSPWAFTAASERFPNSDPLDVSVDIYNLGEEIADNIKVTFELQPNIFLDSVWIDTLGIGASKTITKQFNVSGMLGNQTLITKINPKPGSNDMVYENNVLFSPFYLDIGVGVTRDISVTFDGKKIKDRDYVSAQPTISIDLPENFPLDNLLTIRLDNSDLKESEIKQSPSKSGTGNTLEYKPMLSDGIHRLIINSRSSTVLYAADFQVSSKPQILDIFNYPNPFNNKTNFTFKITGVNIPEKLTVSIFTVAGRKLREITVYPDRLSFDYNSVEWDGLDADGNELANGVYLYKLKMFGDEDVQSNVQKLVKLK